MNLNKCQYLYIFFKSSLIVTCQAHPHNTHAGFTHERPRQCLACDVIGRPTQRGGLPMTSHARQTAHAWKTIVNMASFRSLAYSTGYPTLELLNTNRGCFNLSMTDHLTRRRTILPCYLSIAEWSDAWLDGPSCILKQPRLGPAHINLSFFLSSSF